MTVRVEKCGSSVAMQRILARFTGGLFFSVAGSEELAECAIISYGNIFFSLFTLGLLPLGEAVAANIRLQLLGNRALGQ